MTRGAKIRVDFDVENIRQLAARAGLTLSELGELLHCHHSLASAKLAGRRVWYGPEVAIFHAALLGKGVRISQAALRDLIGADQIYDSGRWVRPERMNLLEKELKNAKS